MANTFWALIVRSNRFRHLLLWRCVRPAPESPPQGQMWQAVWGEHDRRHAQQQHRTTNPSPPCRSSTAAGEKSARIKRRPPSPARTTNLAIPARTNARHAFREELLRKMDFVVLTRARSKQCEGIARMTSPGHFTRGKGRRRWEIAPGSLGLGVSERRLHTGKPWSSASCGPGGAYFILDPERASEQVPVRVCLAANIQPPPPSLVIRVFGQGAEGLLVREMALLRFEMVEALQMQYW